MVFFSFVSVEGKIDCPDENGLTPLMWSAAYGQLAAVQLFLKYGAKIDARGPEGETALLLASAAGHHDIVRLLLSEGAALNHSDDVSKLCSRRSRPLNLGLFHYFHTSILAN